MKENAWNEQNMGRSGERVSIERRREREWEGN